MNLSLLARLAERRPVVDRRLIDHALEEHRVAVRRDLPADEVDEALRESVGLKKRWARWLVVCGIVERLGRAAMPWAIVMAVVAGLVDLVAR